MPRKSEGRTQENIRMGDGTLARLKAIAKSLGYIYANDGQVGALLDAIASGELLIVKPK